MQIKPISSTLSATNTYFARHPILRIAVWTFLLVGSILTAGFFIYKAFFSKKQKNVQLASNIKTIKNSSAKEKTMPKQLPPTKHPVKKTEPGLQRVRKRKHRRSLSLEPSKNILEAQEKRDQGMKQFNYEMAGDNSLTSKPSKKDVEAFLLNNTEWFNPARCSLRLSHYTHLIARIVDRCATRKQIVDDLKHMLSVEIEREGVKLDKLVSFIDALLLLKPQEQAAKNLVLYYTFLKKK